MSFQREAIEGILIGLLIVGIAIILFTMKGQIAHDYPTENTKLDLENLQTGDLLSVSYGNHLGIFITFWSSSHWSHPSMIYRRTDDEIFVVEACRYRDQKWRGVIVMPINKWIELNKKHIIALTKYQGPKIYNDQIERALGMVSNFRLQSFQASWLRFIQDKKLYHKPEGKHKVCYEIMIILMQELGIVKKLYTYYSYWPKDICWGNLDFEDGYSYLPPKLVIF